jgi:hypothetical protein
LEKPDGSRKGRLQAGIGSLPLEGLQKGRLLPADISPRSSIEHDFQVEVGPEYIFAEITFLIGLGDRALEPLSDGLILAPDIDKSRMNPHGIGSDDRSLQEKVRIMAHDVTVFECAGLAFVGIDAEILGFVDLLGNEAPLDAGRKTRSPSSPEVGFLDLVHDFGRLHSQQGFLHGFIAALLKIDVDLEEILQVEILR